ncbi:ATP-binding protein [Butyrivibrio sp. CB08]|uniref:sensor histidine kinase n=1 Tax=Butyrivibrio sp. CB08 TaxID=2364879 RepID=UPI000EA8FEEA|nr:sensor histidine kinase [Butyrivibrio sp. CB08]RKM61141.1 ATP-binding protein [Butyrivibrio sp. CB08]
MMAWFLFFASSAIEMILSMWLFDIFLDHKWNSVRRYVLGVSLYIAMCGNALLVESFSTNIALKLLILLNIFVVFLKVFYKSSVITAIFVASINTTFMALSATIMIGVLQFTYDDKYMWRSVLGISGAYTIMAAIIRLLKWKMPEIKQLLKRPTNQLLKFIWLPFAGVIAGLYYGSFFTQALMGPFETFVSAVLLIGNVAALFALQELMIKDEKIRLSEVQIESKQNQLQAFRDMQSLYERQGRKLHDYKKQLGTVQELLKSGDVSAAAEYVEQLTKSISVEIAEVNVGHPVVNAVLNQQYRIAKEKNIGMTFAVSDLKSIRISDEDIVVLLGNLLENAIHECEKVIATGRTASIQVKFVEKDGNIIIMVKNPVAQRVDIIDNKVQGNNSVGHGIGLINVEHVASKYDGSFAISCNDQEFSAVVMI